MSDLFEVGVKESDCLYSEHPQNYPAYLVRGEKSCLIHTVPRVHTKALIKNIEEIMPVSKLDYVVFLQTEPCWTGALEELLQRNPDLTVVAASAGLRNLKEQITTPFCEHLAKDQGKLDLGGVCLRFAITPNLCWPDSMLCFLDAEQCVFSADYKSAYSVSDGEQIYYRDRLESFSEYLPAAEQAILEHDSKLIYPGHGRKTAAVLYQKSEKNRSDVCICYDSVYGATEEMAMFLKSVLENRGFSCTCFSCKEQSREKILETLASADGWLLGVPTLQRNVSPRMLAVLSGIQAVTAARKPVGVFGSYGWSGEGCSIAEHYLQGLRTKICQRAVRSIFMPDEKVKKDLESMAGRMCEMLSERE